MRTIFTTPEALDDYLQGLNEQGHDATVALVDARSILWLTYGEEASGGGEWMTCWLVDGDPWDDAKDDGTEPECEACGLIVKRRIPLDKANYPVRLLHDGRQVAS
jgi:hypothetical protein